MDGEAIVAYAKGKLAAGKITQEEYVIRSDVQAWPAILSGVPQIPAIILSYTRSCPAIPATMSCYPYNHVLLSLSPK